jgi:hypothetical protein
VTLHHHVVGERVRGNPEHRLPSESIDIFVCRCSLVFIAIYMVVKGEVAIMPAGQERNPERWSNGALAGCICIAAT